MHGICNVEIFCPVTNRKQARQLSFSFRNFPWVGKRLPWILKFDNVDTVAARRKALLSLSLFALGSLALLNSVPDTYNKMSR